ncbi:MAG: neutral zinc metallopeptidase [Thermoleophilia bacterium]
MKWRRTSGSGGVEDLRGKSSGPGGIPMGRIGGGLGGAGIAGIIIALLFTFLGGGGGFDPGTGLDQLDPTPAATQDQIANGPDPDANLVAFVRFVVEDVQTSWTTAFQNMGQQYEPTNLRLFRAAIRTGCGAASSATGPFYCPVDRYVYLDLGFFAELRDRFGAPGDFAQAYVIAHEYGHHVQNLLGILPEVNRRQQENPGEANELSVKLELQADCFAGVWAHSAYQQGELEQGDLEEGLTAAASVGDDRIQQAARGRVDPESFTHGTSEQRRNWFLAGFQEGDPAACNTFTASRL